MHAWARLTVRAVITCPLTSLVKHDEREKLKVQTRLFRDLVWKFGLSTIYSWFCEDSVSFFHVYSCLCRSFYPIFSEFMLNLMDLCYIHVCVGHFMPYLMNFMLKLMNFYVFNVFFTFFNGFLTFLTVFNDF